MNDHIHKKKLAVLGGDRRQIALAGRLAEHGYAVDTWGIGEEYYNDHKEGVTVRSGWQEAVDGAGAVILPLPVSSDGVRLHTPMKEGNGLRLTVLFDRIGGSVPVFGGRCSPMVKSAAESREVRLWDYFDSEELQIRNAVPTAEGAIAIAMNELPVTIDDCRVAVVGYGRVGHVLADKLKLLGANVTVAARRKSDLAVAKNHGLTPLRINYRDGVSSLSRLTTGYDVIFNTVPYWLFDAGLAGQIDSRTLFIDLASAPGGIDVRSAKEHGVHVIWALSLPGKCAPVTAGQIIADTLLSEYISEGGEKE